VTTATNPAQGASQYVGHCHWPFRKSPNPRQWMIPMAWVIATESRANTAEIAARQRPYLPRGAASPYVHGPSPAHRTRLTATGHRSRGRSVCGSRRSQPRQDRDGSGTGPATTAAAARMTGDHHEPPKAT
jgi:hypothetical protein